MRLVGIARCVDGIEDGATLSQQVSSLLGAFDLLEGFGREASAVDETAAHGTIRDVLRLILEDTVNHWIKHKDTFAHEAINKGFGIVESGEFPG